MTEQDRSDNTETRPLSDGERYRLDRAYAAYLERRYPRTVWTPVDPDAPPDPDAVRRRLVSPDDLENLDAKVEAALRKSHPKSHP